MSNKDFIEQVYNPYHVEIYNYILSRLGYDQDLAEDVAQEVFIKALTAIKSYKKEKGSIRTWIYQIARNHLIDSYRKKENKNICLGILEEGEDTQEQINAHIDLFRALKTLKPNDREIIYMKYISGMSFQEIGEILQKKPGAIRTQATRIKKKLKKIL